jgi:hypothetical protein
MRREAIVKARRNGQVYDGSCGAAANATGCAAAKASIPSR